MFNVGGAEALVIAVIALIVLGPQRLPGAARQVGRAVGELRRLSSGFQAEMRSAFDEADHGTASPRRDVLGAERTGSTPQAAADAPSASSGSDRPARPSSRPRRRAPLRADGPAGDDTA